ncbi:MULTISPECIES: hypothetical protein [Spirulina sp. CCY15215]|uniref:hypothetical protein n=1 Tax=Spirulina sp. CCY15215 TaxID=2767591 RepID=UPI001950EC46|nr:hypothetical protein [Spirulina major]
MFNQLALLPGAISEIFATATETGILTLSDRYGLMAATLNENLEEEERRVVNRLLQSIKRGRIQIATA